ncbi:hypothetical protein [Sorangium sp. So ce385]|uniref:hypothetical protein n=1 Tax=Sorangium sp. So ce385 TaxID=3133308 RepID=UPI003F5BD1F9
MRSFCTMGLLFTLSIPGLLAGTGCISPELPDPDSDTVSAGVESADADHGSSCDGDKLPPPPPPPETCWGGELGDGLTCVYGVELKDQAYITCRNQGADLAMFDYERDSPGCTGITTARAFYECCPAAEPLPSPACWTSKIDHGDVCQPVQTLDEEASALCAETGQQLFHIGYGTGVLLCPEASATSALFTCCP